MNEKPIKGIGVDAGTRGNPGPCFYRGVCLESGNVLFYKELGVGTNNIGEFLAVCHAIHYLKKRNINTPIYSDSVTAIAWVRRAQHNTKFRGEINEKLDSAVDFLKSNTFTYDVKKWITKEWGEIPADFGRK
tara:strand:+ start:19297 stop:19692 length:396 start_codon:yes stop_codon:yes gene_type:complete